MCDDQCDAIISVIFFCERKCLDSFSHKPSLRSKILKLETLKQIGQKSEPQSENFACVIHHSSSGPLINKFDTNRTNLTFAFGVWWYLGGPSPNSPSPMPFLWDLGQ